jgi:hypothetical protein
VDRDSERRLTLAESEADAKDKKEVTAVAANWLERVKAAIPIISILMGGALIPTVIHLTSDFIHRNSETSVSLDRMTDQAIYIRVSNSGRKGSNLIGCQLDFGEVPIEAASLEPVFEDTKKTVIAPGADVIIGYASPGLMPKKATKAELMSQFGDRIVTLSIDVEESNNPHHLLPIRVPFGGMRRFINERVADDR